ncbi:NUDIX hydrolase [Halorussus gelatinilyticus]|uniref:NUDIX hydrolase n=1 Tax=Halorussus gelatinilyticus TaxID=2937524 RepID=A0A8U0IN82_9EURY|nr:NUDIX hydrolase [Halorussus gelatinilyticus]UPW02208.1 NUDIX hydrolase [Halorussus gelatinilyticus]
MNWSREASLTVPTPWGDVGYDRLRRPDGRTEGAAWADPRDAVVVVAVREGANGGTADGESNDGEAADRGVVLIEEYRPKLRETVVTCPVGRLEDGESFEAGAARELREETGFDPATTRLLDVHYPVSWLRKRRGIVFATDLTPTAPDRDDGEFTDPRTVPADEAVSRARTTGPATGWTLGPLLLADHEGLL